MSYVKPDNLITAEPSMLALELDRNSPIPIYVQLAKQLEDSIRTGELRPGSRIENEVTLGKRLRIARPTVSRAIQQLVDKGLLVRLRGIGTQVVQGRISRNVELTSLFDDLAAGGQAPTTAVLTHEVITAPSDIADALAIAPDSAVLHLRRLRSSSHGPVSIMENFLPSEFESITHTELTQRGLYDVLRAHGTTMRIARQTIGARRASVEEAGLLKVEPGGPVLTAGRLVFDSAGRAIEVGRHIYRPDVYVFETTLVES